ncbi:MAG: amidohydrolase [Phycisphaerales bacterium JB037]
MRPPRILIALLAACAGPAHAAQDGTRFFTGANAYTMDATAPRAANFVTVDGTFWRINDLLAPDVIAENPETADVIDLGGATVVPGIIDAHGHIAGLGAFELGVIDLSSATSEENMVAMVAARARITPEGQWIVGGRWDHESWPERQLPTQAMLSEAVPNNPVYLTRVDGHAGLANAAAMKLAGVHANTQAPPGGEIIRDLTGAPTGVFVDNAESLITRAINAPTPSTEDLILAAQTKLLSLGITSVHDMGISLADAEVYKKLDREGRLKLRVYGVLSHAAANEYLPDGEQYKGDRFTLRAIKLYADGAMGSRGAWLKEPYEDNPTNDDGTPRIGLAVTPMSEIERISRLAHANGWQVCTHAIGDRANAEVLESYARVMMTGDDPIDGTPPRHRIEHAQLLDLNDLRMFGDNDIIASMQPRHCATDQRWVVDRVGPERAKGAYAWASLLRHGVKIAAGSDFPVEPPNPMLGFHAAVTRQQPNGTPERGWYPAERMTREEALRAFTLDAAYAEFAEGTRGSITPGKRADFVVLDTDIMTCEPADILKARVLMTVIDGEIVYQVGLNEDSGTGSGK